MESDINRVSPYLSHSAQKSLGGLRFIIISISVATLLQLYYLPFTENNYFSWGLYGWIVDMIMPISFLSLVAGLIFRANWARIGLLCVSWISISLTLIGLLTAIGFYDVSRLNLWHYLFVTIVFLWNIWNILYLTRPDILSVFKVETEELNYPKELI